MNKLFLASTSIQKHQVSDLLSLCGVEKVSDINMLLIENAADVYAEDKKGFVLENRRALDDVGINYSLLDLRKYISKTEELQSELLKYHVVWFGGGNTFYLREIMRKSGFESLGNFLSENNIVYAGGSAGSIVVCSDIEGYGKVDDPNLAGICINNGLNWLDRQIIPHWENEKYREKLEEIDGFYKNKGKNVEYLKDGQIMVYENENYKIIN